MKNHRVIVVALAVLLAGSLGVNWVLWSKTRPTRAASDAAPSAVPGEARTTAPRERGAEGVYEIAANPSLQGRLGRAVLEFAEGPNIAQTRTAFYKAGQTDLLRVEYGPVAAELPAGNYDLEISGRRIAGVPVKAAQDTRVFSGVLHVHGASQTRFMIFEPGAKDAFHVAYGDTAFGLPAGEYEVEVSGVRDKVTIAAGQVADF